MVVESIDCPNCGAPLSWSAGQTLVICAYCNSSIRVSPEEGVQPVVNQVKEIPPEVIDEVKRLLVEGFKTKAVAYYSQHSGISEAEATPAVTAMQKTIGYKPPLNTLGILTLIGLNLVSVAGVVGGVALAANGWLFVGVVVIIAAIVFAGMNWYALGNDLKAALLVRRGRPADAVIQKRWHVMDTRVGKKVPVELVHMLLEVRPSGQPAYQTEATCYVGEHSQPRFQVGSVIQVKYDAGNIKNVVVVGPTAG